MTAETRTPVERQDTLFDALGGRPTLERVHRALYDRLYAHPWLGQFFGHVRRQHQENQQTDFMTRALGGPAIYSGRLPRAAHEHLFITEEIFRIRHGMLEEALAECKVPEDLAKRWLYVDFCFMGALVKESVDECKKRFTMDEIIVAKKPS